ncbi:MAG: radical SAM protein [Thermoanaerobaculia bacterium]
MRLLLINPRSPESFWSFRWALDRILPGKRAVNPPLGLATLAALCPESWEVSIVDENIEAVPLDTDADIVGVCGMGVQFTRQRELLEHFRHRGCHVVAGGSYASLCPEEYAGIADTVVSGEAESIWRTFCADFERGAPERLYRETGVVSLHDSPVPRFDLLKLDRYTMVSLQFSRGCPFQCEFCDIIVMFGRKPRTKTIEQVLRELDALRLLGARNVFFVDDNFIGNKPEARALLRAIAQYQDEHGHPFRFGTEASLNLAQDRELLDLFRRANFQWAFIGIESPDRESLLETGKTQNTREDMLDSVRRIYAHGIDVFAGFIIGFDHDTVETFERQRSFIVRSGIQVAMVGLLTAMPRTPLHARLSAEGRILGHDAADNTSLRTNVVPKRMGYEEMIAGYRRLYQRLCSPAGIAARIRSKLAHLAPAGRGGAGYGWRADLLIVWNLLMRGIRPGGPKTWWHFTKTLGLATPRQVPAVISEWISGLSMRAYAMRFVAADRDAEAARAGHYVERLRRKLREHIHTGAIELVLENVRHSLPNVSVTLRELTEPRALKAAVRDLRRLLRKTHATISLRIEEIEHCELRHVQRFLDRLTRHGDRISVSVSGRLRELLPVDWSRFQLVI